MTKLTKYWIILCFMFADASLQAQPSLPDSIRQRLYNNPLDSNYVKNLITAILYLPYSQPDSAYFYAEHALKLSQQLEFKLGIAYSYLVMAECFIYKGDYSKAIYYVYQGLSLFTSSGDQDGINRAYYQLSEIYTELGDFNKALEYKLKVRKNLISVGFKEINSWHNPNNEMQIWFHDYKLSRAYLNMQMIDSAMKYGETAFLGNKDWSIIPIVMGDIFLLKKDYPNALKYYNTPTTQNYPVDSVKNSVGKARVFKQMQKPDSTLIFALKALDIARRIDYAKGILQASEILSDHYETRDLNESLKFLKIANSSKDSLYNKGRINQVNSIAFNDELRRLDVIAAQQAARTRFRIWSLLGVMTTLLIIGILLWRNIQNKKRVNSLLQNQKEKLETTLVELKLTQAQLIQSEKMASLGELTAGIAHEIQNPLNFVNNFSEINKELLNEIEEARRKKLEDRDDRAESDMLATVKDNEEKIYHHGKRADAIVKSMLQHARVSSSDSGQKELTDINKLAEDYLKLAYQGYRAKDKDFNCTLHLELDPKLPLVKVVPQDIGRVFLNLFNNAFWACSKRSLGTVGERTNLAGLQADVSGINLPGFKYSPTVSLTTKNLGSKIEIRIRDNGPGIPSNIIDKIFQPFFTTKPAGQGTGLGLSLSYDLVTKGHGGSMQVYSEDGIGAEFVIQLPV